MERWNTTLQVDSKTVQVLITDAMGNDRLKASLPSAADHPRALLTMLEGLALWSGYPLHVVVSVVEDYPFTAGSTLFGADLLPVESALVKLEFEPTWPDVTRPLYRLSGVGNFRRLRKVSRMRGGR